ncbi:MAG: porin [Boseongicola sp.]|nr:porin [Boseongicola sp.]
MKRLFLSTTALALAGGMASAEVSITGFAEMGVAGSKGSDAKLHKDIDIGFDASGATDTGLSFGLSIDLDNTLKGSDAYDASGNVHLSGAFGTVTLGDTDGAFDKALSEVGSATAIADDHTSHPGYNGNSGLDGFTGNGGNILRYDYSLGDITTSASMETGADNASNSVIGVGMAWSGDVGGVGIGIGLGYQTGSNTVDDTAKDGSITGLSVSVDMGNSLSLVANASSKDVETEVAGGADTSASTTHTGIGVAYSVGDLTIGVNGGTSSTKGTSPSDASGAGFAVVYNLGTGVTFQVGAGSGEIDGAKSSSWSTGLAFSF